MRKFIEDYGSVLIIIMITIFALAAVPYVTETLNGSNMFKILDGVYDTIDIETVKIKGELRIDGVVYKYEEGMSWQEWINSSYNTAGYTIIYDPCTCKELVGNVDITLVNE